LVNLLEATLGIVHFDAPGGKIGQGRLELLKRDALVVGSVHHLEKEEEWA
jgi:hypothetical protein